jgi:hypothetical protein
MLTLFTALLGAKTSLLEMGVQANQRYWQHLTSSNLEQLLQRDVAIEAKDQDGCTALIWACRETKDPRVIELLLAAGASPNEKAKNGWTPLHWVATFSKGTMGAAITKTLLDHGADPMVQASGMTPLEWARRNDNPAVEAMLNPATARAAAASLDLDKAMKGPLSGLRADKVKAALNAARKAGVGEASLERARKALQLVVGLDNPVLRVLEALGMTEELAPLLLAHDLLHVETIAHIDVTLLMSTLGVSLGKAARLHRAAIESAAGPAYAARQEL